MAEEAQPRRWFRRARWGREGLETGPWHLIVSTDRNTPVSYAACGVDSYMRRQRPDYASIPSGELPQGNICEKCRRKAA